MIINRSSTSTDTTSACNSYLWNGNSYTTSGIYSYTTNNSVGCDSTVILNLTLNSCTVTLNLKLFLEGFYIGSGKMSPTLSYLEFTTNINETDTLAVDLWSPAHLSNPMPDFSTKGILHSDGTVSLSYPATAYGYYYYLAIKHRNSLETWSAGPILISAVTQYDFTTNYNKAFGDGSNLPMKYMGSGVYAIYSGDINQDGGIDIFDLQQTENDASEFAFGYNSSDCQGDGGTDIFDLQMVENNGTLFLYYARPL